MTADAAAPEEAPGLYAGWLAGLLIIVGVMAVGAFFWFTHHP